MVLAYCSYELSWQQICPYPYADGDDEIELACSLGVERVAVREQDVFSARIDNLSPYTKYNLKLQASNDAGSVTATRTAITLQAGVCLLSINEQKLL